MALVALHKSKHSHTVSKYVCDPCILDGLPKQLHQTLYTVNKVLRYCETHMILAGLRAVTPDFIRALNAAKTKADAKA